MTNTQTEELVEALLKATEGRNAAERALVYADHAPRSDRPDIRLARELEIVAFEIGRRSSLDKRAGAKPGAAPSRALRLEDRLMAHLLTLPEAAAAVRGSRKTILPHLMSVWTLALKADFNSDRLGALWWVLEPLLHVILITAATFILHGGDVFDMPAFPFVVIGAVIWLTFRTIFIATIAGPGPLVQLLEHPSVTRFDIIVARALRGLVVNLLVGFIILATCVFEGWAPYPENELKVVASFFAAAVIGLGAGLVANQAQQFYPGLRKIYVMILRVLAMFSGLFYVSEQVPEPYLDFVLWNPVLHISQFARSGWFDTYESTDASLVFVMATILVTLSMGFGCAMMNRRTRARAGEYA